MTSDGSLRTRLITRLEFVRLEWKGNPPLCVCPVIANQKLFEASSALGGLLSGDIGAITSKYETSLTSVMSLHVGLWNRSSIDH